MTVVPVVIDELDAALPTLEAVARYLGGMLLHPRALELDDTVPAAPAPALRAAIENRLTIRRGVDDFPLALIDAGAGRWTATIRGRPADEGSNADRELIGLAKALIHRDIARREFAIVAYSEPELDVFALPAAWDLVTQGLLDPMIALGTIRTLVIAVGAAEVSIGRHCQPGGLAYALDRGTLRARNPSSDLPAQACRLAAADRLVLFLGAGFSRSSRLPLGDEMRDQSMQRQLSSTLKGPALAREFYRWASGTGRLQGGVESDLNEDRFVETVTLENVMRIEQRVSGERVPQTLLDFKERHDERVTRPGRAVLRLGELLVRPNCLAIVTVNFDELIERNFPDRVQPFTVDTEFAECPNYLGDYFAGRNNGVPLLKLHGTISRPETCMVTDVAIREGLSVVKRDALAALLPSTGVVSWVYVGASMRDADIVPVLAAPPFVEPRRMDERWAIPYPEAAIEEFVARRRRQWLLQEVDAAQARYITEYADDFLAALASHWP